MLNFVWLKTNNQVDIWQVLEQQGNNLTVIHSSLKTQKKAKLSDTVGHWVWYIKDGNRNRGYFYRKQKGKTLVRIPVGGFGEEVWADEVIHLTVEESADFAFEVMMRCKSRTK